MKLDPQGLPRLFLYTILGMFLLILLPHAVQAFTWLMNLINNPAGSFLYSVPEEVKIIVAFFVLGLFLGLLVRALIRLIDKI